jgi:glycosyltransferase involved in cell wall biosynthesis
VRVLHFVKTSVGAAWACRQMRELAKLGVDVHVVAPDGGALLSRYESAGVVVHHENCDLPVGRPWSWVKLFSRVRTLVESVRPDIIHSHFVGTTTCLRLALGRKHPIPRVFQVPGPLHLEHWPFRNIEISLAGPNDYWVGSCRWTCRRYEELGVARERMHLSFYGSDLEECMTPTRGKLRKEIGISDRVRIVGMVAFMYAPKVYLGQTRGLKGHEDLIEAFAILQKVEPRVALVMVGGAWSAAAAYERRVREYARRKCGDAIVFLGTRGDVHELYPDFDVAVHPSHSENLGGAAESLLHGIPTVASNVGGLPDLVVNGETGWLVPPRDPSQLAEAIREALNNPEEARMRAERGQKLARQLLDVRQTARQVYDIYREILSKRND